MAEMLELVVKGGPAVAALAMAILFMRDRNEDRKDRAAERISQDKKDSQFIDCMLKFRETMDAMVAKCTKS